MTIELRKRSRAKKDNAVIPEGDALDLLRADHVALLASLEQLRSGHCSGRTATRRLAAVCNALIRHAEIERELFYPALRNEPELAELLDAARIEHQMMNELVAELASGRSRNGLREARIEALAMYAAHHFDEEHTRLFPRVRASGIDLVELGRRIADRRAQLDGQPLPASRARAA